MKRWNKTILVCMLTGILLFTATACSSRDLSQQVSEEEKSQATESEWEPPEMWDDSQASAEEEPTSEPDVSAQSSQEESTQESRAQEESKEESTASAQEESGDANANPETGPTPFSYPMSQVDKVYLRNYKDFTYTPLNPEQAAKAVKILQKVGSQKPEPIYTPNEWGFMVVLNDPDRTRMNYTLLGGAVRVGDENFPISQETYEALKALGDNAHKQSPSHIQWLIYMNPDRVTGGSYAPMGNGDLYGIPPENALAFSNSLKNIQVAKNSGNTYNKGVKVLQSSWEMAVFTVTFNSGVTYTVALEKGNVFIESSDMDYGCVYKLVSATEDITASVRGLATLEKNPITT